MRGPPRLKEGAGLLGADHLALKAALLAQGAAGGSPGLYGCEYGCGRDAGEEGTWTCH